MHERDVPNNYERNIKYHLGKPHINKECESLHQIEQHMCDCPENITVQVELHKITNDK